jgi:hypothetical protein
MFSALRKQVNPAMILALVALVFAVTGGAYAASSNGGNPAHATLTASAAKAKAAPKGKAGPRGPAGPKGATGATGAAGAAGAGTPGATGPQGPAGPAGAGIEGKAGANGTNGVNGTSATSKSFAGKKTLGSQKCEDGGSEVTTASGVTLVCNGTTGFTATLPEKQTETGTWAVGGQNNGSVQRISLASFAVPLSAPLPEGSAHFINSKNEELTESGGSTTHPNCPGTAEDPAALPGNLCVYATEPLENWTIDSEQIFAPVKGPAEASVGKTGAVGLAVLGAESGEKFAGYGTWAVTEKEE